MGKGGVGLGVTVGVGAGVGLGEGLGPAVGEAVGVGDAADGGGGLSWSGGVETVADSTPITMTTRGRMT
jgi:hypothetical protein